MHQRMAGEKQHVSVVQKGNHKGGNQRVEEEGKAKENFPLS